MCISKLCFLLLGLAILFQNCGCLEIVINFASTNLTNITKPRQRRYYNFRHPALDLSKYGENFDFARRVFGGKQASAGQFPHQVSFKKYSSFVWSNYCGGSIISGQKVLSAGHCFDWLMPVSACSKQFKVKKKVYAVAGSLMNAFSARPRFDSNSYGQWRSVRKVILHSEYKFPNNDLALVFLTRYFQYNILVKPIPLATTRATYSDCTVSGFGSVWPANKPVKPSAYLLYAGIKIINTRACTYMMRRSAKKFICGDDTIGTAAAKGDSGGPLICSSPKDPYDRGQGVLAGVVSAGIGHISVYTRITSFKDFIASSAYSAHGNLLVLTLNIACLWIILVYHGVLFNTELFKI